MVVTISALLVAGGILLYTGMEPLIVVVGLTLGYGIGYGIGWVINAAVRYMR